jgi:hypothetical protein
MLNGSEAFDNLSDLAWRIYWKIAARWTTHSPDRPVEMSIEEIRKSMPKHNNGSISYPSRQRIVDAIKELILSGVLIKETRHRQRNRYYIEQKYYTGEYR